MRGTGQAIASAVNVIRSFGGCGGRIITFLGGSCTSGPGKIISNKLENVFRNHNDIEENSDSIYVYEEAKKFYNSLISLANGHAISIDIFAFCLT